MADTAWRNKRERESEKQEETVRTVERERYKASDGEEEWKR